MSPEKKRRPLKDTRIEGGEVAFTQESITPQLQKIADFINDNFHSSEEDTQRIAILMQKNLVTMTGVDIGQETHPHLRAVVVEEGDKSSLGIAWVDDTRPPRVSMTVTPQTIWVNGAAEVTMQEYSQGQDCPTSSIALLAGGNVDSEELSMQVLGEYLLKCGHMDSKFNRDIPSAISLIHFFATPEMATSENASAA